MSSSRRARVADDLRRAIEAGELAPGDRLPSEADLADRYTVSRATIRSALATLASEGHIYSEQGAGSYVRAADARTRLNRSTRPTSPPEDIARIRIELANAASAATLAVEEGTEILIRESIIQHDRQPTQLVTSEIPRRLTRNTPLEQAQSHDTLAVLAEHGHHIERFVDAIHTRMPTPSERAALQLGPGDPVLTVIRTGYGADDRPVLVETTTIAGRRVELLYEVPVGAVK